MNNDSRISFAATALLLAAVLGGCAQEPKAAAPQAASSQESASQPTSQSPLLQHGASARASGQGDYRELNENIPGQPADVNSSLAIGKRTIVEFWSPYCGPCMALRPLVKRLAVERPDLAVRSINVNRPEVEGIDWRSPVIQDNPQIRFLPYFLIYGPDRKLELEGQAASEAVVECLKQQASAARQTR